MRNLRLNQTYNSHSRTRRKNRLIIGATSADKKNSVILQEAMRPSKMLERLNHAYFRDVPNYNSPDKQGFMTQ